MCLLKRFYYLGFFSLSIKSCGINKYIIQICLLSELSPFFKGLKDHIVTYWDAANIPAPLVLDVLF